MHIDYFKSGRYFEKNICDIYHYCDFIYGIVCKTDNGGISLMICCTIVLPNMTFKTNPSTPRCGRNEHCCTGRRHGSNLILYENLKNELRLYNLIKRCRRIVICYHVVLERRGKSMNDCRVIYTFCNRSIL